MAERTLLTRRGVIIAAGAGALALPAAGPARAANPPEMDAILAGRTPKTTGLTLDIPSIAENGLVVPINIAVDSPMTDASHVKAVHVFATGNPNPLVATFRFTPACGRAAASSRMRLAQTQDVVVLAEMSNNDVLMAKSEVKVTIGGCGG